MTDLFTRRGLYGQYPAIVDWIDVGDCWMWEGTRTSRGYGSVSVKERKQSAHRVFWETLVGPIPDGLVIDHLCRVRACVNPDHMRLVTNRDNLLAGYNPMAKNSRKTHCPKGHAYTIENTYRRNNQPESRRCRQCRKERQ